MKIKKCMGWIQKAAAVLLAVTCSAGMLTYQASVPESETGIVASAYSNGDYKVNTKSGVNVRSKANDTSSKTKLGAATNGTSFTVDQISGNWGHTKSIKCTNGTREGWVCLDFCTQMSTPYNMPFTAGTYQVKVSSSLRVREKASTVDSDVITTLKNGTQIYISSKTGDWGYVDSYGGYVHMDYCTLVKEKGNTGNSYTTNAVSNGIAYCISPACATGSVLDSSGWGTSNGTNVQIWTKHGGANQQFKPVLISDGYYAFYEVNSGKVLDVSGGIVANGTNIQLYDYNGSAAQLWHTIDAGSGYYYLQSKLNSSFYLDVNGASSSNGTNVQLYEGNGTSAQKFKFTKATGGTSSVKVSLDVPLYKQGDSRWKNTYIGTKTIGKVGCTLTSIAMLYSYKTHTTVYPNVMKNKLSFSNNSVYWSSVTKLGFTHTSYNTTITQNLMSKIYTQLKNGKPVMIGCKNSSGGEHWVVITGYTGSSTSNFSASNFTINDPGYNRTNLQQHLNYVNVVKALVY